LATPSENSNLRTLIPTDGSGGSETVHVEYKPYRLRRGATQPPEAVVRRVRALGNLLCQPTAPDAGFHTLRCRCILKEKDPNGRALNRYAFVFHLPDTPGGNTEPVNLLTVITAQTHLRPTLGERFKIAQTIATTAFQLHSVGWLHKSIRSENILFFPKPDSPNELDYSRQYLVGFEFSRDENDTSTTEQDDVLERNIYRHPDRQGPPDTRFSILHDVYAIGVVLLEIGLWRPVVEFDSNFPDMGPDDVRQTLETHARLRLPHYMGKAYTEAVLACLGGRLGEGANGGGARNVGAVETVSRNIEQLREEVQLVYNERIMGGIESGLSLE